MDNPVDKEVTLKLVLDNALAKEVTLLLASVLKELILAFLDTISVDKAVEIDDKLYEVDVLSVVIFKLVVDKLLVKEASLVFLKDVSADKAVLNDAKLYNSLLSIILIKVCNDVIILMSKTEYVLKTLLKYCKGTASVGLTGLANPVNVVFEYIEIT